MKESESGKVFTTTGATGAVTFTLPDPASTKAGTVFTFVNTVDQNMIVATTADKMVALNDAAATNVTFSTTSQKIGAAVRAVCDGSKWLMEILTNATVTVTA